jgi:hypothetical protein
MSALVAKGVQQDSVNAACEALQIAGIQTLANRLDLIPAFWAAVQ